MSDLFSLEDRITLVTGGSRGIGKVIARAFIERGAKVYISSRKAEVCEAAARELSPDGTRCIAIPEDASSLEGIRRLAAEIGARESRLDVLINNAGAAWAAEFDEFPESGWDKVMNINLKAPFFLTKELAPLLRAAASPDRPAKVINVSSIDGIAVNPLETYPYAASKAGLIHLTKRMALRLIRDDIVVSSIAPGAFRSDMNVHARDQEAEVAARIPARRIGRDDDIAAAAIYLASRAGDYVVGATLVVDGGSSFARGAPLPE
jgi:NAD(P)-dependent dehydrogenase (short-subunit alcohol dehydrogenase family)